ncbi:MAG: Ppx/GppA family phosphatase [Cyanobacteria bacterium SID2]|nr:Ppx/GppA family phosphatase [Cyanobacteria bacterium SID2]
MVDAKPVNPIRMERSNHSSLRSHTVLAAIDIGTNSIHMVVVKIQPELPAFTIITREKETVRLGDRNPKNGNLRSEAIDRSISALRRCQEIARSLNAEEIVAVATSATREAPNGRDFIERVKDELDLSIDLISGQEEARRIYLGVLSGMEFERQPHIVIDIGGGSTELVLGDGQEPRTLSSTKVGAVRLTAELVTTDPIDETEYTALQGYVRGMLERPVEELQAHLKPGETPRLVGTSGTIETLAAIDAIAETGSIPIPLNGYHLKLENLKKWVKKFRKSSYNERLEIPGIGERRAEIILAGATVLQEAMSILDIEELVVCERALREGVIVDWMLKRGLIENKLCYQSSVRERSTLKIAKKYQVDLEYSQRIADFAIGLFDQLQGELHDWDEQPRELLWGAAILHNCGLYISHSAHHKHSYYLIRNGELLGYTELEIELIANLARYHRKSTPKKKHDSYANLSSHDRLLVRQLSALMRLAIALDRRQIGAISKVRCDYRRDLKQLNLYLYPKDPHDPCELERWSLDFKKDAFEEEFGIKLFATLSVEGG